MSALFDLRGRTVLITGGNQGIGLGIAEGIAGAGADIVLWGRDADSNAAAAERLRIHGSSVLAQSVDVSDEARVIEAMDEIIAARGRIDGVIACAGARQRREPFPTATTQTWRQNLAVNLDGVFWTFREACRHMKAQGEADGRGGSLVAISSLGAVHGIPAQEAYAAAKGGIECMTRSIAVECARYGIRANVVQPGWVATEMTEPARSSAKVNDAVVRRIPMRRWGEPSDFAGIAVYLMSDASRYHTGSIIAIDGGYSVN
jgi:NAD(P)-dependent dehydrogenase (short-subunit alcohol dehydrogenase family)